MYQSFFIDIVDYREFQFRDINIILCAMNENQITAYGIRVAGVLENIKYFQLSALPSQRVLHVAKIWWINVSVSSHAWKNF